jgi:hypothetical protein
VEHQDKPNNHSGLKHEPIAIVGMSCRFPGLASCIDGYWRLLNQILKPVINVLPGSLNNNKTGIFIGCIGFEYRCLLDGT